MNVSRKILYLASKNAHKLKELQSLIPLDRFELRLASDLSPNLSWVESGKTFEANALIKARAVKALTPHGVLADDSGLEVQALLGAPGVYSSRYAGRDGDDQANNDKLLLNMTNVPSHQRQARFCCCLVYLNEQGEQQTFWGYCEGGILESARGQQGFGYDSLFFLPDRGKTMAELSDAEKNTLSHRGRAIREFLKSTR